MKGTSPERFDTEFETTRGRFVVTIQRDWAPRGADRFHSLIESGFFAEVRFFRVIKGFMAQFGISPDPRTAAVWRVRRIDDDPVVASNTRGRVSFATAGPGTRTTQLFINLVDNSRLDSMGFAPVGEVTKGMDVVDSLFSGYGEGAPSGRGPAQDRIQAEGNAYLDREFPELDAVLAARIVDGERGGAGPGA
ncbi:hypothetical protein BH18GEM1_BH18GEM1_12380 [soil metagenome]